MTMSKTSEKNNRNKKKQVILGAVLGAVMAILLLWLAFHLAPGLSQPGGPLSPEAVEKSYLTRLCFRAFHNLFS